MRVHQQEESETEINLTFIHELKAEECKSADIILKNLISSNVVQICMYVKVKNSKIYLIIKSFFFQILNLRV